jgi:hypothetical protein
MPMRGILDGRWTPCPFPLTVAVVFDVDITHIPVLTVRKDTLVVARVGHSQLALCSLLTDDKDVFELLP